MTEAGAEGMDFTLRALGSRIIQSAQHSVHGTSSGAGDLKEFLVLPWGRLCWKLGRRDLYFSPSHVAAELPSSVVGREGFLSTSVRAP